MFAIALLPNLGQLVDVQLNLGSILVLLELSLFVWLVWYGNRPSVLARFQEREAIKVAEVSPLDEQKERTARGAKPSLRGR